MKKTVVNVFIIVFTTFSVFAHSGKAKYHAVVDMDNSHSAMNALTLVLANNEIEVLAVLTNDAETQTKVSGMMKGFYHEGIPVFELSDKEKAVHILMEIFNNEPDSITYLELSGFKNISLLSDFGAEQLRLSRVIAFVGSKKTALKENKAVLNYLSDKNIPVDLIGGQVLLKAWKNDLLYNPYAEEISHQYKAMNNQLLLEKEFAAIFLKKTSDFIQQTSGFDQIEYFEYDSNKDNIAESLSNSLNRDFSGENKVFSIFPQDETLFAEDVRQIMDETMFEHGYSEWRACVITNELHGHLGIYAVVGAKMGIRVREYFRLGVDDIHITSFAGGTPPFSCLNDGLQVSTGGTIGHGLIELDTSAETKPAATFSFKNHEVYMELKPEYWAQIKKDIGYGVQTFGLGSEKYWAYVRKLALKYWHDWDRHHIFIMN